MKTWGQLASLGKSTRCPHCAEGCLGVPGKSTLATNLGQADFIRCQEPVVAPLQRCKRTGMSPWPQLHPFRGFPRVSEGLFGSWEDASEAPSA